MSHIVDAARMVSAVLVLTMVPMISVVAWTLIISRSRTEPDAFGSVSIGAFPNALSFGTEIIPTLSFFVTMTVSSVLTSCLSKYSTAMERFNCFSGQCYDLALLLAHLVRTSPSDDPALGALSMKGTMQAIGLLPSIVKFHLRGDFNIDEFVGSRSNNKKQDVQPPTSVFTLFRERYVAAHRAHPEDDTMPFQIMFELIVHSFEGFKDRGLITEGEWETVTRRLETVYGPWGDMCTKKDYAQPRLIQSFLSSMLYLYYLFLAPYLVATFDSESTALLAVFVVVFLFSGCYEAAGQIANPYASSKDNPFFFSSNETVTNTAVATRNNINRLMRTASAGKAVQWSGLRL